MPELTFLAVLAAFAEAPVWLWMLLVAASTVAMAVPVVRQLIGDYRAIVSGKP